MDDRNTLTFVDAVRLGFREWRNTGDRASRRAFWYWFLFTVLMSLVAGTVDMVLRTTSGVVTPEDAWPPTGEKIRVILDTTLDETLWTVATLVSVLLFVPTLTVTIRRFRDSGSSVGLAWAVHLIGPISLVALLWLGYELADVVNTGVSLDNADDILTLATMMLVITLVNVVAFIGWLIIAFRPTRSTELR
jgi:uncharacterized membrane protein YhaH (DUF805 family)